MIKEIGLPKAQALALRYAIALYQAAAGQIYLTVISKSDINK